MARRKRDDHGAAAVELALVLPMLLLLVFAAIDFGILFAQNLALNNAARDGARLGAVENTECAEIEEALDSGADSIDIEGESVDWEYTCGYCEGLTDTDDPTFEVTAEYSTPLVLPLPFVEGEFTLDAYGGFKCEYS